MAAAAHPLVVCAFAASIVNLVCISYHGYCLWEGANQDLLDKGTQRPAGCVDVSCWMSDDVAEAGRQYAERTCSSRFKKVITGQMDLDSAGISVLTLGGNGQGPTGGEGPGPGGEVPQGSSPKNDTVPSGRGPFAQAMMVMMDQRPDPEDYSDLDDDVFASVDDLPVSSDSQGPNGRPGAGSDGPVNGAGSGQGAGPGSGQGAGPRQRKRRNAGGPPGGSGSGPQGGVSQGGNGQGPTGGAGPGLGGELAQGNSPKNPGGRGNDDMESKSDDGKGSSPRGRSAEWQHLLPLLFFQAALTLLGFLVAVCYTRLARSHACFLNVAWRRAASGEQVVGVSGYGGKASLLERNPELVSERLRGLLSSRMVTITYFLITLVLVVLWIVIGISMVGYITKIDHKIERAELGALALATDDRPTGAMKPLAGAGDERGPPEEAVGRGAPSRGKRDLGPGQGPANGPQGGMAGGRMRKPRPTYAAGDFLCDFQIANTEEAHSLQCGYEVSRDPVPFTQRQQIFFQMQNLISFRFIMMQNLAACLIVGFILLLHICFMYFLESLSLHRAIFPILNELGARPKDMGLKFALTDLFFVAAFTDLGKNSTYLINTSGAQQEMMSVSNSNSNMSSQEGPLPAKSNV